MSAVIDALNQRTEYSYDLTGNLTEIKDANSHITKHEYNKLNQRIATILPMGQRATMTYDAVGNLASMTDFNGKTISYEYDAMNRMAAKRFADNSFDVEYTYTPTGEVKSVKDSRGFTVYEYDARQRLKQRSDPDEQFVRYEYDAANQRTAVTTAAGTTAYTFDKYHQLKTVSDPAAGVTTYSYDKVGNLTQTNLSNGVIETHSYDERDRLTDMESKKGNNVLTRFSYTLDASGNRTAIAELGGRTVNYTYDKLYRLVRESAPEGDIAYTYDAVGNRLTKTSSAGTTTSTYDANDRLLSDGANTYSYDNNGNTTGTATGTATIAYTYDDQNRLISAQLPTGMVRYGYDAHGIRISSATNGSTTNYLIDDNRDYAQVLEETRAGSSARYVYSNNLIVQTRTQARNSESSFFISDALNSTRALTNSAGTVTDKYTYDAYGNLTSSTGTTANNYLYAGEQFDQNLGDYYLRARYYKPSVGRFTTRDPFEGDIMQPLSMAKYPYVHGNPVNAIDPDGRFLVNETLVLQAEGQKLYRQLETTRVFVFLTRVGSVIRNNAPRIIDTVNTGLSIYDWIQDKFSEREVNRCNLDQDLACRVGFPVIVYGIAYFHDHTMHIADAIAEGKPSVLNYQPGREGGNWYDEDKYITCSKAARKTYLDTNGKKPACDEYPFATTAQGGEDKYLSGLVSLRLVDPDESARQTAFMGNFYNKADKRGRMMQGEAFGVLALRKWFISGWIDSENRFVPYIIDFGN
ncbi:RHS repeat-associated core domain-containing protein [Pseudanabaena sp. PCC 6802]|uniref:RHS repeat-associated core domain-containing protein n=1 Tax=Pseudanabaena sp. PCC 6802 TaxID=118173 RepID=UPI0003484DE4|nr:RHS repeat-associated core domain-containing protein [Pseudanabaena sp. PCC 6802]